MRIDHVVKNVVKKALRDDSQVWVQYEGRTLWKHDVHHLEVAKLPRIPIGGYAVNGIDGVTIPEFGNADKTPAYNGVLDEVRIGIHAWACEPTHLYVWVAFTNYCVWMLLHGINPVQVVLDHIKSMSK